MEGFNQTGTSMMWMFIISSFYYYLIFLFLKRETREVDESLTANLIEEAVYDSPRVLELAARAGQLGYNHNLLPIA